MRRYPFFVDAPVADGKWGLRQPGRVRSLFLCRFDIVMGCQLNCIGCPNSVLNPKVKRISVEDFRACLANIDVKAIDTLGLYNYGEPLLHSELPALLREIPAQKFKVRIVELSTNAQFADWTMIEAALRERVVNRLVVSCDGDGTAEEYERLRPPSRWERLVEFLNRASDLRNRIHPELELMTRTICMDAEGQARWRALLEPLGWQPEFRSWISLPQAPTQLGLAEQGTGVCSHMRSMTFLYVNADGDVVPCCYDPKATVLGNLKRETANEIFAGPVRSAFVARLAADRSQEPICGSCQAR